ncbi:MAG TPA: hypothetical protein VD995_28180 [Azospirillum sp.]|nr:hypothetical protein [Azospirillum sp.]
MATIAEALAAVGHADAAAARLRARFAAGPAMDAPRYTRHLEAAYRTMWRRWCAGLPPEPFDVPAAPGPNGR